MAGREPEHPVVLALPRGGVPVGFEVAKALGCELDVLVVRKVGVPIQPELAMAAVGEGGVLVQNEEIIGAAGITEEILSSAVSRERDRLERRVASYREIARPVDPAGMTAVVVDDGLATGSTAEAAIRVVQRREAAQVWLAIPVAPRETIAVMRSLADEVIVLSTPMAFGAVGIWYRDFSQTTDDEVRDLLGQSRLR